MGAQVPASDLTAFVGTAGQDRPVLRPARTVEVGGHRRPGAKLAHHRLPVEQVVGRARVPTESVAYL